VGLLYRFHWVYIGVHIQRLLNWKQHTTTSYFIVIYSFLISLFGPQAILILTIQKKEPPTSCNKEKRIGCTEERRRIKMHLMQLGWVGWLHSSIESEKFAVLGLFRFISSFV
jgi:hypothetical protein